MSEAEDLVRALAGAYRPFVRARLSELGLPFQDEVDDALEEGTRWLQAELEALLALPFHRQPRAPLELFQEAMRFPTEALRRAGAAPRPRDEVAERALPGDIYDLAPPSSAALGEEVWRAHLAWGAAKAGAVTAPPGAAPRVAGMETTRIDLEGAVLDVHARGAGPLALLVHGFPLDHRMWTDQLLGLASQDRRVAAPDLRGHGTSPWMGDEVHAMELLADDLAGLIRRLGQDGRADVAGLSMGGYVVLALQERHPEVFRSMALVDTRSTPDSEEGRAGRDTMATELVEAGRGWLVERMLPGLLAPGASLVARARVRSMIEAQPVESLVADLRGMRDRPDRTRLLSEIEVPVLVAVGERDGIAPPEAAEAMADEIRDVSLVVVPEAGHMAPLERPEAVSQALADLWERADR